MNKDVVLFYFGSTWAEIGESFAHFSVLVQDTESIFCVRWVKIKIIIMFFKVLDIISHLN